MLPKPPQDDDAERREQDEELDEALEESFPASDPIPMNPGDD